MKHFKWDKKYLYGGVTAFCVVVSCIVFYWTLNRWDVVARLLGKVAHALMPFLYGLLIAYLLIKVMVRLERGVVWPLVKKLPHKAPRTGKRMARAISIIITELLALGVVAGLLVIFLPQIYRSIADLIAKMQGETGYLNMAAQYMDQYLKKGGVLDRFFTENEVGIQLADLMGDLGNALLNWLKGLLPQVGNLITVVTGSVVTFVKTLVNLLIGIIFSVYLLYNKETFCAQIKKLVMAHCKPKTVRVLVQETAFINTAFGDYIAGTLIDALVVGLVTYFFMLIAGMPYTALIAILIGVTNIIPFFGPFIGAIPACLLLLLERPLWCLIFAIFILILQQLDGHVIKPRIHSSKAGISGFWIMLAIIFFGSLFGILGMIFGVPVTTVLYSIVRRIVNRRLRSRGLPENTTFYKQVAYVDPDTEEPVYKKGYEPKAEAEKTEKPEKTEEKP